jgi:hypothetical protein
VARTVRQQRYRAVRVAGELENLLSDKRLHTRAEEVGAIVRSEDGAVTAAAALDALIH